VRRDVSHRETDVGEILPKNTNNQHCSKSLLLLCITSSLRFPPICLTGIHLALIKSDGINPNPSSSSSHLVKRVPDPRPALHQSHHRIEQTTFLTWRNLHTPRPWTTVITPTKVSQIVIVCRERELEARESSVQRKVPKGNPNSLTKLVCLMLGTRCCRLGVHGWRHEGLYQGLLYG
jgi:hypothetical protein